jgi:long-chain acyl-CoA synthetase
MGSYSSKQNEELICGVWTGEEREGETRVLRNPLFVERELNVGFGEFKTIWEAFETNAMKSPNKEFLGTRKFISNGVYGEYEWKTYQQIYDLVISFAKAIVKLELCPTIETEDGEFKFMGIYSRNKEEWYVTDLACQLNSCTVVTLYDTLGDSTIPFVLNQTQLTTLTMESKNLKKIIKLKGESKLDYLKNIILFDIGTDELIKEADDVGLKVYHYNEILDLGKKQGDVEFNPCKPDTFATFSYTSGTTGNPKGVMLKHIAIMSSLGNFLYSGLKIITPDDVHLSFLPLAHIAERVTSALCITLGMQIGIYQGDPLKVFEDIQVLKPTFFLTVPRVLQKVYDGIMGKISNAGFIGRTIFERALSVKLQNYHNYGQITHSIYDRLVFNKIKAALGGRVKLIVTGAAPISRDLKAFSQVAFCCPIIEGYGLTESSGSCCLSMIDDFEVGHVGGPTCSSEVKLIDCPSLSYFTTDKDEDGKYAPRGEICIRGTALFSGYFCDKENTNKTLDKEGWVHTGDIGCVIKGGRVKLIDRVKNIFKLSNGEYVAPEKIENVLIQNRYVLQIMVHGESIENYLVAIVYPNKDMVCQFLNAQGKKATLEDVHSYYDDEVLKNEILKELDIFGRGKGLNGFEIVKKVLLINEMFSVDNGLLTATMKLKRNETRQYYKEQLRKLYLS